jgi:hypothetical protein
MRRFLDWVSFEDLVVAVILILFILVGAGLIHGCSSLPDGKTSVAVKEAKTTTANQGKTLADAGKTASGLTSDNLPNQKPVLVNQINTATEQNKQIGKSLDKAESSAKTDEKTIATSADPVKVSLQRFAFWTIIAGISAVVFGFFFSTKFPTIAPWFRNGGAAAIIVGLLTLIVAYFVIPILFWIATALVAVLVVGAGVWVYLHRKEILPGIEAFAKQVNTTVTDTVEHVTK